MNTTPEALARYIAASNAKDIDAMLATFSPDAIVKDEGKTYRGHSEIRPWMVEVSEKYNTTAQVTAIAPHGDGIRLDVLVSGTFPGSPATLHYDAVIRDGLVARLAFS